MNGKLSTMCNYVRSKIDLSLAALSVACVAFLTCPVFAEEAKEIEITPANLNWASLPSQIIGALMTPIIVGIGVALSVWVVFKGLQFFRRTN